MQDGVPDGSPEQGVAAPSGGGGDVAGSGVPMASTDDDVYGALATAAAEVNGQTGSSILGEAGEDGGNGDVMADLAIEDGGTDEYREILCLLDDQHRVANDVFKFYDKLDQHSKPVATKSTHLLFDVHRNCEPVWAFLMTCSSMTLSKAQIEEL